MSRGQNESLVLDTGVLVEYVGGSEAALRLKRRMDEGTLTPHVTDLNLFELRYLICRKHGAKRASDVLASIQGSGYFDVHDAHRVLEAAASLKCERALSLVDCVTIATGEALSMPVLFARHEAELDAELKKHPFEVELRFLSDLG